MNRREFIFLSLWVPAGYIIGTKGPLLLNLLDEALSSESHKEENIENKFNIKVVGKTDSENILLLDHLLEYVSLSLDNFWLHMQQVNYISVKGQNYKEYHWNASTRTIDVVLLDNYFFPESYAHELGHAHLDNLEEKSNFISEWKHTMIPNYFTNLRNKNLEYSRDSVHEDVATIVRDSYWMRMHLYNGGHQADFFTTVKPYYFYTVRDMIGANKMFKRMNLLRDYGFISSKEHEIMKPLVDITS